MPQLDPLFYPSQILWLTLVTVALYLFVSRYMVAAIDKTLSERSQHIQSQLQQAQQRRDEAEHYQNLHKQALETMQEKTRTILQQAQQDIEATQQDQRAQLQDAIQKDLQQAEQAIQQAHQQAQQAIQQEAAPLVVVIAHKVAGLTVSPQQAAEAVKKAS